MSSLNSIIDVQISRDTKVPTRAGFGSAAFVSNEAVFAEFIKIYADFEEVQADTLAGADTLRAAASYFGQQLSSTKMYVIKKGRDLVKVQNIVFDSDFVTGNVYNLDVDGAAIGPVNFTTDHPTTMAAIAAAIAGEAGVATAVVGGANNRTITVTGATVNTDVLLANSVTTGGAAQNSSTIVLTQAQDEVQTIVQSIARAQAVDNSWYALSMYSRLEADILAVAAIIEPQVKLFFCSNDDSDVIGSATTDIATQLKALGYDRTVYMYSASSDGSTSDAFVEMGWSGGQLPKDPGSITWAYKSITGTAIDNLSSTQENNAIGKNANVYVEAGGLSITKNGVVASGEFIDVIRGSDFIAVRMQEDIFFLLANEDKIPYTDQGIASVENSMSAVLRLATNQGILAADPPYTTSVPKASEVSKIDKGNRLLPDMSFLGTLAGAVHKMQIRGRLVL